MIELQSEERSRIWHLCYEWQEAKAALDEFEFDIEEFKRLAKEFFDWLEKFFCELTFPYRIVHLLLCMKEFACCPSYVSAESLAAQFVVDTLCDVENGFGITGDNYEVYPDGKRNFSICLTDTDTQEEKEYQLDTDTFDISELAKNLV